MGDWVWTKYRIGGKLTSEEDIAQLQEIYEEFEDGSCANVRTAIEKGEPLWFQGQCNYGTHHELEAFCRERALTFWNHWSAGCDYGPGIRLVTGNKEETCDADEDGNPTISLRFIKQVGFTSLERVTAYLESFDDDQVPVLTYEPKVSEVTP